MINYHRWWSQDQQVCATLLHFEHEPRLHWGKVGCFHFHWNGRGILIEDQTDINSSMGKCSQKMPFRKAILKTTVDFFEEKNPKMVIPRSLTQVHMLWILRQKCTFVWNVQAPEKSADFFWGCLPPLVDNFLLCTRDLCHLCHLPPAGHHQISIFTHLMTIINHEIPMINNTWSITKQ